MTYLERYKAGDCAAVWDELNALGEGVFARKVRDDAFAVAMETMRRLRADALALGAVCPPAPKRTAETLKALEKKLGGKLPMSLSAWWLQAGELRLESLTVFALNPASLFRPPAPFYPPRGAWQTSIEAWRRRLRAEGRSPEETEAAMAGAIAEFNAQDDENDRLRAIPFDARLRHPLTPHDIVSDGASVALPQPTADFPFENTLFIPFLQRHLNKLKIT